MPAYIKQLTPNGLQPASYTADSLTDAAQYEPHEGVYTITNTYQTTKVLKLDAHLNRLEDSAARANIPLQLDRSRLRAALRTMIADSKFGDVRFRITVPKDSPNLFILTIEPYIPPSETLIKSGIRVITIPHSARTNAAAKTTDWMHERTLIEQSLPKGVYTGLLCDDHDNILEGLSSNFYAIINNELRTAGSGVLAGIAQQIVFEIAPPILAIRREAVRLIDIPRLQESFITSSSRGIIPVIQVDSQVLSNGTPGETTQRLIEAYHAWVDTHLEEL